MICSAVPTRGSDQIAKGRPFQGEHQRSRLLSRAFLQGLWKIRTNSAAQLGRVKCFEYGSKFRNTITSTECAQIQGRQRARVRACQGSKGQVPPVILKDRERLAIQYDAMATLRPPRTLPSLHSRRIVEGCNSDPISWPRGGLSHHIVHPQSLMHQ